VEGPRGTRGLRPAAAGLKGCDAHTAKPTAGGARHRAAGAMSACRGKAPVCHAIVTRMGRDDAGDSVERQRNRARSRCRRETP
jgi:hypothetical protein